MKRGEYRTEELLPNDQTKMRSVGSEGRASWRGGKWQQWSRYLPGMQVEQRPSDREHSE